MTNLTEVLIRHRRIVLALVALTVLAIIATGGVAAEGLETGIEAACENAGDHAAQHDHAAEQAHSPLDACREPE